MRSDSRTALLQQPRSLNGVGRLITPDLTPLQSDDQDVPERFRVNNTYLVGLELRGEELAVWLESEPRNVVTAPTRSGTKRLFVEFTAGSFHFLDGGWVGR